MSRPMLIALVCMLCLRSYAVGQLQYPPEAVAAYADDFCYPLTPIGAFGEDQVSCRTLPNKDGQRPPVEEFYFDHRASPYLTPVWFEKDNWELYPECSDAGFHLTSREECPTTHREKINCCYKKYHLGEDWNGYTKKGERWYQDDGGTWMSASYGRPVFAVGNGKVLHVQNPSSRHSWGRAIVIQHRVRNEGHFWSVYAHLSEVFVPADCKDGNVNRPECVVRKGQWIGNTGDSNGYWGPHLHFEIRNTSPLPIDGLNLGTGYAVSRTDPEAQKFENPTQFLIRLYWFPVKKTAGWDDNGSIRFC